MPRHLKKRWINRQTYEYFAVNIAPYLGWCDPILVYQMGKVASSSIRNSLFRCPDPRTRLVLMSHEFFPLRHRDTGRIDIEPEYREHVLRENEHEQHVIQGFSWRKRLGWRFREKFYTERIYKSYVKRGDRLRVITLVREPVANNISMFFEVFDHYAGTTFEESTLDVDAKIELFLERYMHWRPIVWLDAELKTTLGVDVYQCPFPHELGYSTVSTDRVDVLVLRSELDDRTKAQAIADFLGLDEFEIVRTNVASERSYARQYAEFKQQIKIPPNLLDQMYNSKYARHFYSREEREQLRARWSGHSPSLS